MNEQMKMNKKKIWNGKKYSLKLKKVIHMMVKKGFSNKFIHLNEQNLYE